MRYSKSLPEKYLSSTAVVCSELLKLLFSTALFLYQRRKELNSSHSQNNNSYSIRRLLRDLFGPESDCLKILVPALLYLLQNNLQYYSATKLDAATLQITSQLKLIIIAVFSVLLLKHHLIRQQWIAIFLLAVGIALVQLPSSSPSSSLSSSSSSTKITPTAVPTNTTSSMVDGNSHATTDKLLGFLAVTVICLSSGFAGVYFEKILKRSQVSIWARNVQLSLFSLLPGYFIGCLWMDGDTIREKGFFSGYTRWTLLSIMCQSFGGMIIAVVVKYADNILKGFANSLSILLSCILSYLFFNFHLSVVFCVGCFLVLVSTVLYALANASEKVNNQEYNKCINQSSMNDLDVSERIIKSAIMD